MERIDFSINMLSQPTTVSLIFVLVRCFVRYWFNNYNMMHTSTSPFSVLWTSLVFFFFFSYLIIIFSDKLDGLMSHLTASETCFEFLGETHSY